MNETISKEDDVRQLVWGGERVRRVWPSTAPDASRVLRAGGPKWSPCSCSRTSLSRTRRCHCNTSCTPSTTSSSLLLHGLGRPERRNITPSYTHSSHSCVEHIAGCGSVVRVA